MGGPQSSEASGETHPGERTSGDRDAELRWGRGGMCTDARVEVEGRRGRNQNGPEMNGQGEGKEVTLFLQPLSVVTGREYLEDTSPLFKNYTNDTRFKL